MFARRAPTKARGRSAASASCRSAASLRICFACALSSALTARILLRMSATSELLGELHELVELGARRSALDDLECLFHPVLEASGLPGDVDGRARVEPHDVARRSGLVFERRNHH